MADYSNNDASVIYHRRQFDAPYRSTIAFCAWLEELGLLGPSLRGEVVDLCAGMGGNLLYLSQRYPARFVGVEFSRNLIAAGSALLAEHNADNASLEWGDIFDLGPRHRRRYAGALSFQSFSWFEENERALEKMAELDAPWLAFSSLVHDGNITCRCEAHDYGKPTGEQLYFTKFITIFAMDRVRALLESKGYRRVVARPFELDLDLPRPTGGGLGTYTERLADGRRLQFTGPMHLPWCFVAAMR